MTKEELIETISGMTVLELSELVKALEEKFGVSAAPVMAAGFAPAGAGAAPAEAAEERTQFDLELSDVGPQKIQVIKVVREFTTLGLKEAKELVESAPKIFKTGVTKEEAQKIVDRFKEFEAKVTIK